MEWQVLSVFGVYISLLVVKGSVCVMYDFSHCIEPADKEHGQFQIHRGFQKLLRLRKYLQRLELFTYKDLPESLQLN